MLSHASPRHCRKKSSSRSMSRGRNHILASARLPLSRFHHRCLAKVEISSGRWLASSWKSTRTASPSNWSRETAVLSLWGSLADSSMLRP